MIPKFEKGYCPDLLSWKELSNILNIRPLMSTSRVKVFIKENLTWQNNYWCSDANCYPSGVLEQVIEESGVCSFIDMSRSTEKINEFAKNLEDEYDQEVDAHIYLCRNLKIKHPFGIHFDTSDNVIVQCEGETNFKVWDIIKNKSAPLSNMSITDTPLLDVDMKKGDAIWIPRYYPHLATSNTQRLSVSFPFNRKIDNIRREDRHWIKYD
mgnify:FL=1|tara:strand:- start:58 stop:687 length:630 start_codon:yes stop_codon:yes gene_type:complete